MRILVLQSGGFEHFLAAAGAAAARYPSARLSGLVTESDAQRARTCGRFTDVQIMRSSGPGLMPLNGHRVADLCVVPFEDRFGVRYWKFRMVPIIHRIPTVAGYNKKGHLRERILVSWILNSLLACGSGRVAFATLTAMHWAWNYARRRIDIIAVFGLAGLALLRHAMKIAGLPALARRQAVGGAAEKQRVVIFIPSLGLGGAQRQLASYLRHLDRSRWDPEVITLDARDKFFEPEIRALDVPLTLLSPDWRLQNSGVTWQLVRRLREKPCHVLHNWLHYAVAVGAMAGALAGVPRIVGSVRSERPSRFPWFYPKWQRGIDVLTAPLQNCIIGNSNAVREEYRRWVAAPQHKLVTIYNGIDGRSVTLQSPAAIAVLRAELKLPLEAPVIGIVGRLFPEKDHATFLKAAALIHQRNPDVQFLIVGEGSLLGQINTDIVRLDLSGVARTLGGRKDALALIQLCDVLVLTSTTEGFPNVLLEAFMAGTPVVTTAAGGAPEVVLDGETGFVVPCRDAEAVAGRVLHLLEDPGLRQCFVSAARDRMKRDFSADQIAARIQACYEQGITR